MKAKEPITVRNPFRSTVGKKRKIQERTARRDAEVARLEEKARHSQQAMRNLYISPLELSTLVTALNADEHARYGQIKRRVDFFAHHGYETFEQAVSIHAREYEHHVDVPAGTSARALSFCYAAELTIDTPPPNTDHRFHEHKQLQQLLLKNPANARHHNPDLIKDAGHFNAGQPVQVHPLLIPEKGQEHVFHGEPPAILGVPSPYQHEPEATRYGLYGTRR